MKKSKDLIGDCIKIKSGLLKEALLIKGESADSIEQTLFNEHAICGKPVIAIRQREPKYEQLITTGVNKKKYTGLRQVDSGFLNAKGYITLKIKADAPRYLIHYFIDKFLDASKSNKNESVKKRLRSTELDALKAGKEIAKELQSGKSLLRIAKERTGINENPAYDKIVKAEYEKVKRYFKAYQNSI